MMLMMMMRMMMMMRIQVEIRTGRLHWMHEKVQSWRSQVVVAHLSLAEEEMIFHAAVDVIADAAPAVLPLKNQDDQEQEHHNHPHEKDHSSAHTIKNAEPVPPFSVAATAKKTYDEK